MGGRAIHLLVAGLFLFLAASAAPASAAFPGHNGKIAYTGPGGIHVINPDGTGDVVVIPHSQGHPTQPPFDPSWSPDGTQLVFVEALSVSGTSVRDIYKANADGTGDTFLIRIPRAVNPYPAWSPDGTKIVFRSPHPDTDVPALTVMNADGTGAAHITNGGADIHGDLYPRWSPDGTKIVFQRGGSGLSQIYTVRPDGTQLTPLSSPQNTDLQPEWSPDGSRIAFVSISRGTNSDDYTLWAMAADGSDQHQIYSGCVLEVAWSPDGQRLVTHCFGSTFNTMRADGTDVQNFSGTGGDPDWQPIPVSSYVRPKGATPLRASLVRAFAPCTSPNRTHGPPLASPSCGATSPAPHPAISPNVNVGTPDHNNGPANFVGSVRLDVSPGDPATVADEADVSVNVRATDLRCFFASSVPACGPQNAHDGDDYTGELQGELSLRVTDRNNTPHPGGPGAATVQDAAIDFVIPCAATSSTLVGGDCSLTSSMDAVVPGSVVEGRRAIWQLGQVRVFDGGPDADADTADNALFATQGVFIP